MNTILKYLSLLFSPQSYTLRNYMAFLLVLFCIQYIPIESRAGVSWVKVGVMVLTGCILLRQLVFNKALCIALLYAMWIIFTSYVLHPLSFRASTVIYLFMFLTTFVALYTFVWCRHVFDIDFFIKFVKRFIFVLVGVLIAQQCCLILGIKLMPILNLCQILDRGIGANSLTFEPSTLARILLVLYYAYLKCNEYKNGQKITAVQIFDKQHRCVTLLFLWAMFTMGSGTAFICLGVLSLYFMRGAYFLLVIPIFVGVYFLLSFFQVEQFERAASVAQVTLSGDAQAVVETDGSASTRVAPMLNTFNDLDLSEFETWVGHGIDYSLHIGSSNRMIGAIGDYGLIAHLLGLILVFSCAIRFRSLATIMFFIGLGGGMDNISYQWGTLMIFSCVRYFYNLKRQDGLD